MAQARCPHCSRTVEVPDCLTVGLLLCPGCAQGYTYQGGAVPEPAPPLVSVEDTETPVSLAESVPDLPLVPVAPITQAPTSADLLAAILAEPVRTPPTRKPSPTPTPTTPQPRPTLLIAPHVCQHCSAKITTPINRRAATVPCPHPDCGRTTSVYALQFRCGYCAALLETSQRLAGRMQLCPACQRMTPVPSLELPGKPPWPNDPNLFACECPSCSQRLIAARDEVGLSAVCSCCRVVIQVPNYGTALENTREPVVVDQRQSLKTARRVRCTECDTLIPVSARLCPICQTPNRPGNYPAG